MGKAGVDGALIVQPINHMFDHSLVTRSVEITMPLFSLCQQDPVFALLFIGVSFIY